MFWCYPGQQERVCLRRGGGTRESTRRCVRRACGACAAQNWSARGKQPATRSSSSQAKFSFRHRGHRTGVHTDETQARGLARGRAPLSPLAFFLDSTELYVYLCTVVHTSVRIPLYSTRPTISLIVQQKKLSTSNKPITHYNVHCRLCRTGTPNRNTVERKTVRIHIRTSRTEPTHRRTRTTTPTHGAHPAAVRPTQKNQRTGTVPGTGK